MPSCEKTSSRHPRMSRNSRVRLRVALLMTAVAWAVPSCVTDTTSTYTPPPFTFVGLTTTTESPVTSTTDLVWVIPVVSPGSPSVPIIPAAPPETTTTSTIPVPVVAPATPPPAPPTCAVLLDAVQSQVGVPAIPPGGEEFDDLAGHRYVRCYGNVSPTSGAPAGFRSALFEITAYPPGEIPATLTGSLTPFADDDSFGLDVLVTEADFFVAHDISDAVRSARFPCGPFECWLYLEESTLFPADADTATLDAHIRNIAAALRASDPVVVPDAPTTTTTLPKPVKPTCDGLYTPIGSLLELFKLRARGQTLDQFPDNETHDYVGCFGWFYLLPPSGHFPNPSFRTVEFQIWAFEPGKEPAYIGLDPAAAATPVLGNGVTSDGGALTVLSSNKVPPGDDGITLKHNSVLGYNFYVLGGGGEPYDLRRTEARRTVRFPCGAFDCYMTLTEDAYAPPDPDLTLLDLQLKLYIAETQAYMASLQ